MKIKKFDEFEKSMVFEYHAPGSINENKKIGPNTEVIEPPISKEEADDIASIDGKRAVKLDNYDDSEGKKAKDTPQRRLTFEINRPSPNKDKYLVDPDHWSETHQEVYGNLKDKSPCYIQGESGWGKTSVLTQMCHALDYSVITVYLAYAMPEDLGGLKLPVKDENNEILANEITAPPVWAKFIMDHPEEQFVLFLDELNQANNKVLNALMPIIHEHILCGIRCDNFFCIGAGNMLYEADLNKIPHPVLQRLGGKKILWISGTVDSWDEAFKFLHKKWDSKIDPKLIEEFHKEAMIFGNPRDIDLHVFKNLYTVKEGMKKDKERIKRISVGYYESIIADQTLTVRGVQADVEGSNQYTPDYEKAVKELAEKCYAFLKRQAGGGSSSGDKDETQKGGFCGS